MTEIRERDIEAYLVKRVKERGGEIRKVQWIGRRGAPDRRVGIPARDDARAFIHRICPVTAWVELKAPGVAPEAHQLREHARMRAVGETVLVIDSFEAVDRFVEGDLV